VRQLCLLVAGKRLCAFFIEGQTGCTAQEAAKHLQRPEYVQCKQHKPEKSNFQGATDKGMARVAM